MLNHSASFARWHLRTYGRALSRPERLIIESLERQRHASPLNSVLAAISDPGRRYTLLLSTYAVWFQRTFCPRLDSLVFVPETTADLYRYQFLEENLRGLTIRTARQKRFVACAPLGIAIMFGSDLYCPSYPNWKRPKIHTFLTYAVPAMPLRNHLMLIVGDATHRRTFFADGFTGRMRRCRNPFARPIQLDLRPDTYQKLDTENLPDFTVEQVSRPAKEPQGNPRPNRGPNAVRTQKWSGGAASAAQKLPIPPPEKILA